MKKVHFYILGLIVIILFTKCRNDFDDIPEQIKTPIDTTDVAKMYIETEYSKPIVSKLKTDYINCQIEVASNNSEWNNKYEGKIRGRGNSTWHWYDKKPYRIKLNKKDKMLGIAKNKDWVLLANYRDPTHLMNTFVFHIGRGLELPYTNNYRYIELYLNNEYIGLYQLTEQIEQGKNRVNVDETEGILLSLDADDGPHLSPEANDNFWSQIYYMPICIKHPKNPTSNQIQNINNSFKKLEKAIQNANYNEVEKLLDIKSFIDFMIIQELVYNVEVDAPRSMYIHKKDDSSKWTMGPLWDFDAGYDFDWSTMYTGHNYFKSYKKLVLGTDPANHINGYYVPSFFTDLFKNKEFVKQYKERWNEIQNDIVDIYWEQTKQVSININDAMASNAERWPIDKNYNSEIFKMGVWINNRVNYLNQVINNYPKGVK